MRRTSVPPLLLLLVLAPPSAAAVPFAQGSKHVTATVGAGTSYGGEYLILGLGVGTYVRDGLGAGVDFEGWLLDSPRIYRLSPEIHYVFWNLPGLQPYAGGFYRRTFVDGLDDLDTLGIRGGVMFRGAAYHLGVGLVWEQNLRCDESVYSSCSATYPEARFTFFF
jgi:hypothetical protein